MKQIVVAAVLSFLLSPCFSYAADVPSDSMSKPHHRTHVHGKIQAIAAVDINHASAEELRTLKGIGEKKADAIIAYRELHGAFKSVDDLTKIKGIGRKFIARLEKDNPDRIQVHG